MKTFEYRGYDLAGHMAKGLIEGLDLKDAREKLSARGVLAERLAPAGAGRARSLEGRQTALDLDRRAVMYRELATLSRAGLPLAHALDVLIQAPERESEALRLAGVRDRLREGQAFADAWAAIGPEITLFEKAVLVSGERAGTIGDVLHQLAGYLDEQEKLRDSVVSALIYPAIVTGLALLVGISMFGFIIPTMSDLFRESRIELPAITRMIMAAGRATSHFGIPLLLAAGAGVMLWIRKLKTDAVARERWEQRLFDLPFVGHGYRLLVNLRFSRTMSLLLRGGVPMVEAMELAGAATGSTWLRRCLHAEANSVRDGRTLAQALHNVGPLGGSLPGWIQAGEASGDLDRMLEQAAERYQQQWSRFVRRLTVIIEPVLILAVGLFVLVVALAILMPIMQLNKAM
jgi:general secretion pathway protein F